MAILRHRIFGMKDGNFSPAQPPPEFLGYLDDVYCFVLPESFSRVYAPKVNFGARIATANEDYIMCNAWLARPNEPADGFLVEGIKIAVAIFNADCPVLCLYQDDKLAVLHAGYRCLIRADPTEEGIIEVGLKLFDPQEVQAFIFGGIGSCCWKPEDDKPEIQNPDLCRHPEILRRCLSATTTQSPVGSGYVSVDLYRLACELLLLYGMPNEHITWDNSCTCHAVDEKGQPRFWSHTRFQAGKQKENGRNMTLVWLE